MKLAFTFRGLIRVPLLWRLNVLIHHCDQISPFSLVFLWDYQQLLGSPHKELDPREIIIVRDKKKISFRLSLSELLLLGILKVLKTNICRLTGTSKEAEQKHK